MLIVMLSVPLLASGQVALAASDPVVTIPERAMSLAKSGDAMTEGEVRRIDKDAKEITLKHGEIMNLGMPAMTMVFRVRDPAMLDAVRRGERVRFKAESINGEIVVTRIEAVR
jgi:Cu/Ag efflux protein CusF